MSIRLLIAFVLLVITASARAEAVITVLASDQKAANRDFIEVFQRTLRRIAPGMSVREVSVLEDVPPAGQKTVVVAVGSPAVQHALQKAKRTPIVAALLPRFAFERLVQQVGGAPLASGVFLDQPEDRQMALLSLLPGPPANVGLIRTANNVVSLARLRSSAARHKLKVQEEVIATERELAAAVNSVAVRSDVLLATPDPDIFNPQTIQGILLSAYRARVPLIGFSAAYTRAGALVSLHSSVQQLAEQTAELTRAIAVSDQVPAAQSPNDFEISINRQVARSMGLELPSEASMVEQLKRKERAP